MVAITHVMAAFLLLGFSVLSVFVIPVSYYVVKSRNLVSYITGFCMGFVALAAIIFISTFFAP